MEAPVDPNRGKVLGILAWVPFVLAALSALVPQHEEGCLDVCVLPPLWAFLLLPASVVSALFGFAGVRRAQDSTLGYWLSRSALVISSLIWLFVLSQVFS